MSFFHLRSLPGHPGAALPASSVRRVWDAYQTLDRTQWLKLAELEQWQLDQLRVLLTHCVEQVPYYARLLSAVGLVPARVRTMEDFRRIPLLTRKLCQTHFADLTARRLPPGMVKAHEAFTSGTNGEPLQVLQTNRVGFWWLVFTLRDLEWCDLDPRGKLAAIRYLRPSSISPESARQGICSPCWVPALEPLIESGPAYTLDIHQEPHWQLEWLRQVQPDYLLSMPANLEFLAGLIKESGQPLPGLRGIQAFADTLTEDSRAHIEAAFRAPVKNLYSCTEAGYLASPCPQGHGLHVHAENAIVEVLDAQDQPCAPGQTGRVVLTTLRNFLTPLIRYDILDDATLASRPCPCGRGLPLWTGVQGRRHPLMHLVGGKRKIVTGLCAEIRKAGGVHQFQIVQRAVEHVILRVIPNRSWTPEHQDRLRRIVHEHVEAPIRVDVELRERLELPPGGKLRIAVIEMDEKGN